MPDAYALIAILFLVAAVELMIILSLFAENNRLRADVAKMDLDGDGRVGGSRKRA